MGGLNLGCGSCAENTTEVHSVIPASATQVLLSPSNINRILLIIYNNGTSPLYIKYGTGVSSTSFTYKLFRNDTVFICDNTDDVYGIWDVVVGDAQITETLNT